MKSEIRMSKAGRQNPKLERTGDVRAFRVSDFLPPSDFGFVPNERS